MRTAPWIALLSLTAVLVTTGCSREYGYSRSAFNAKFVDKTLEQAIQDVGEAARTETPDKDTTILVYEKKTFDQESGNAKDSQVKVTFTAGKDGVKRYSGVEFVAE